MRSSIAILFAVSISCSSGTWQSTPPFKNNVFAAASTPSAPSPSLPQSSDIIFRHDLFDDDADPQVGSITYSRTGTVYVEDGSNVVQSAGADTIPFSKPFGATESFSGAWIGGSIKNWLLYSEDFSDASWVKSGMSVTANQAVAPDGNTTADLFDAGAGSTLTQDSGQSPSSYGFVGSVWIKSVSGTVTPRLLVFDGGTQKTFVDCEVDASTWRRCQVSKKFDSGTSTGTVSFQIKSSSDLYIWGAQLERFTATNTLGSRYRYGVANPYVKTTSAVADTGNSSYVIPNSIVSQIANKGSMQMWVYPEHDEFDSGFELLFSVNAEQFALYLNGGRLRWYWNNSIIAQTGDATSFREWFQTNAWNHIVLTWDATADRYKIYLNGTDLGVTAGTASDITTSTYTMSIGGYNPTNFPYIAADAWISQIVLWDIELDSDDVADAYAVKSAVARRAAPGTGLLFEADLGQSLVPTTGDKEFSYSQRSYGSWFYPDSPTTLAAIDWGEKPSAVALGGGSYYGLPFNSNGQNIILQSEDIGTTWSTTGSPTLDATGGTFLGTITYGTIAGNSGDGIYQDVAVSGTDKFTGSVYGSVSSGTLAARLTLIRDPAGAAETINQDITLTTTPQRFSVYADFASNPTTVRYQMTIQATGTARVGAFQLEPNSTLPRGLYNKIGSPYQRTTTTATNAGWLLPIYRGKDAINPNKGTAIFWAYLNENPNTDHLTTNGPVLLANPGQGKNIYLTVPPDSFAMQSHNVVNSGLETPFSLTPRTWTHFASTWEISGSNVTIKLYVNGVLVDDRTSGSAKTFEPGRFAIGGDYVYGPMDFWSGAIGQVRIYGEAKDGTFVTSDYNSTKGDYGL